MRLIDADALSKKWQEVLDEKADEKGTLAYITFELFIDRLKEEPSIEAEPVKCGLMSVETVDYGTHYRKYYFCPSCNIEIGHKTFDENRQIGQGTVLHSNKFPNYCPNCGAKMESEE